MFFLTTSSVRAQTTDSCQCTRIVAEQMPILKQCAQNDADFLLQKRCSDKALLDYLYTNIRYTSQDKDISPSMMVFEFIISETGNMQCIRCIRSSGYTDLDNSVLATLQEMAENLAWLPARQDGQAVCTRSNLPIRINMGR